MTPTKDYTSFYETIGRNSETWSHYLMNTWLVKTNLNEGQFAQALYPHMTQADRLLVIEVKGIGQGWLPKKAWEWIRDNSGAEDSKLRASLLDALAKSKPPPLGLLPPPGSLSPSFKKKK